MNAPIKYSSTSTSMVISWTPITANAYTGAATITSYELAYDQGIGTSPLVELQGYTTLSTLTTYSLSSLTAGIAYSFQVRAYNSFGWGDWSAVSILTPSDVPDTMATLTTSVVGTNVLISWAAPSSNGIAITAYNILIRLSDNSTFAADTTDCDGSSAIIMA
jgi:hypothetical protein